MAKKAAFLRGINIGGRVIKMDALKECLADAGFKNIKTILQSGNVVFETSSTNEQAKRSMEDTLSKAFNYKAKVQIVSFDTLSKIVATYPFGEPIEGSHDYVIFIENALETQLLNEQFVTVDGELIQAGDGVIYRRVEKGSTLETPFAKLLIKPKYKEFNTTRNLNTLQKVLKA